MPDADEPNLLAHLRALDAETQTVDWADWAGVAVPTTYGEPQAEYASIRKAAGLVAGFDRGVVAVTGRDRLTFLNNLLTNGLVGPETKRAIQPGHGCHAFLLNLKGRVVADCVVIEPIGGDGDTTYLVTQRHLAPVLADTLDRYRFTEKVRFRDASADFQVLSLHGPGAIDVLADAADGTVSFEPTPGDHPATSDALNTNVRLAGVAATAYRDDSCGVPGVHLLVPDDSAVAVWDDLTTRFGQTLDERQYGSRRLRPVGWAMFNACRIEAGRPILGIDFPLAPPSRPGEKIDIDAGKDNPKGNGALPAETGPLFEMCVSVTSGCYLGQEVVARMYARRAVAKRVVGVRMVEDALPTAGVEVEVDGRAVGTVTSSTISPILSGACLCLATLKRPHFETGTKVSIPAEGRNAVGETVDLPFLPADPD